MPVCCELDTNNLSETLNACFVTMRFKRPCIHICATCMAMSQLAVSKTAE